MNPFAKIRHYTKTLGWRKTVAVIKSKLRLEHLFQDYIYWYVYEPWIDWRMGVDTLGYIDENELNLPTEDHIPYMAVCPHDFKLAMKHVQISPDQDVFLDYGSGMGRAVVLASAYPFKKVIGVEISGKLCETARSNIQHNKIKKRCLNAEIVECDAAEYALPSDVTVILIYNAMKGMLLRKILQNIQDSLQSNSRVITLLFTHPENFEHMISDYPWLQKQVDSPCWHASKCSIFKCAPETQPSLNQSI